MKNGSNTADQDSPKSVKLQPKLDGYENDFVFFCQKIVDELKSCDNTSKIEILETFRNQLILHNQLPNPDVKLVFAKSVILDFIAQGWHLEVSSGDVFISQVINGEHAEKELVKASHLWGRNAQLKEKSVRDFILGMERRRLTSTGWHSIYSLMRDGADLAKELKTVNEIKDEQEKQRALSKVICPYIQFVEPNVKCAQTGLRLSDIWRYFRHTWTNEYKSIPGRLVMILIRDAAVENHPVIGIAALGSSVAQHWLRDQWIGWRSENFVENFVENPDLESVRWLLASIERLINDIYIADLDDFCAASDIKKPSEEIIQSLIKESEEKIQKHREIPQRSQHNRQKNENYAGDFFKKEAESHLYRSKRCKQLARLLNIRLTFQTLGVAEKEISELRSVLNSSKAKNAIAQLVRMIKAEHAGIDMMDITVCGAIAPYNALLGGKLVCMLLCSSEVTQYYNKRYSEQISVIASAMKGQPVVRKPNLVLLCTTSLYGINSSQYNRVKIPLRDLGIESNAIVEYKNLGHSRGFGTYHFSSTTIKIGQILNSRKKKQVVNSIFGEGVNPLMRKIREALNIVNLDHDRLMRHGNRRVTYGIQLADNFRDILMGIEKLPHYYIPQSEPELWTKKISSYWRRRWLSQRIANSQILESISDHKLAYPIFHGAVVPLPDKGQESVFFSLE